MPLTIYHNPRCSKSRQTLDLLVAKGRTPTVVEYLKRPPSVAELTRIVAMLGVSPRDILRKAEANDAGIAPDSMTDKELIEAMVRNPIVIERPIVVNNGKAALGRPPENVLKII
ncbi:MAG: arsenate reductase (glutaredoxin) [Rhodospirillaceae bacterium]|nr:arsenate reductase (glutaredoxin) [Rhodospirillaceae bacterium]